MKILFINPHKTFTKSSYMFFESVPPLGLGSMVAFTKINNYETHFIDCIAHPQSEIKKQGNFVRVGLSEKILKEELLEINPGIIGIGCNFTAFHEDSLEIASICKGILPHSKIVLGGAHATMDGINLIKHHSVDLIVKGEGEHTFLEYLRNPERTDINGTVAIAHSKAVDNPDRDIIVDLDNLPFPDYEHMNMGFYFGDRKTAFLEKLRNKRIGYLNTSRGCLYNCIFCSTCKVFKKFRGRSPIKVVNEIEFLMNKYKIKEFAFFDDCLLASRDRIVNICKEMIKRRLNIKWSVPPGVNICLMDKELLKLCRDSGMHSVTYSIESGNPKTLKYMRKPLKLEQAEEIIKESNRLGIWTSGNFIIGFPHETADEIEITKQYILNSNLDAVSVLICQPLKGSDLYDIYQEAGLLGSSIGRGSSTYSTEFGSKHFSPTELNQIRSDVTRSFLRSRIKLLLSIKGISHFYPKINSFKKFSYFLGKVFQACIHYDLLTIIKLKNPSGNINVNDY